MAETKRTTPSNTSPEKARLREFDWLRSIAIVLLFLHHGGMYNFAPLGVTLDGWQPYVEIYLLGAFIFTAGYFSWGSYVKRANFQLGQYMQMRLARLYPPYLIALLLFVLILGVRMTPLEAVAHGLGIQLLLAPRYVTAVFTLWFVSLILMFYVFFGLLIKISRRPLVLILISVGLAVLAAVIRRISGAIDYRFFYYLLVYMGGVLLAWMQKLDWVLTRRFWLLDKLVVFVVATLWFINLNLNDVHPTSAVYLVVGQFFSLAAIILSLAGLRYLPERIKNAQLVGWIAEASFFAYLLHRPLWEILLWIFPTDDPGRYLILVVSSSMLILLPLSFILQSGYSRLIKKYRGLQSGQGFG